MCLLTASKAPCNAARLSFRIENRLPKPNNIYLEKITPKEAVLRWEKISANATIYGVLLGYKLTLFGMKSEENITLANDTNYVVLTNLNPKSNYTLSVRGFTKYGDGYTLLYNFVSLDRLRRPNNIHLAKITSKEAVIRWEKISSKPKINGVLLGYKLILTSRKRKLSFISANDTNHVVFPDLAPKSNYTLSIRGFTQYSDGYAVLYNFSSLDLIPAPKNIQVVILSKTSVGIQWFLVQQREEKYDKIFGYRVNVRNATHSFQIDTLSVTYSVVLRHLSPDANYSVSVFGFGNGTKGISSKWIHFKINDRDEKSEDDNTGAKSKDARNFTLTIVVVLIVGIIAGAIFVLIAVYLLTRHERRVAKSQNITAVKFSQNDKAVKFAVNPANNIH
ncbi:collagen alpha-1(XII) chain-like isoform X1 [Dendronephthya gigantea]|uniref:collagen alpha-1(XII) chain-like isoform X1 n=1 Tax=Dendronephthya gigantea TaxID=151771 RepID=UPI001069ABF1|nr:collagen alpha-1(XII) chain-like isoform X1 [Dendronephthya gigantea]